VMGWLLWVAVSSGCANDAPSSPLDDGAPQLDATTSDSAVVVLPDGAVARLDGGGALDASAGIDAVVPTSDGPIVVRDAVVIDTPSGPRVCSITQCAQHRLQCGDCIDNDGDGRIDADDAECLGPCDNTEGATLLAGVGGESGGPCASDCYFDFGNGSGNDQCYWDHRCDPLAVPPDYPPEGPRCPYDRRRVGDRTCPARQSTQCLNTCLPLTPNGCDCFGCCTFPGLERSGPGGTTGYVWLGSVDAAGNGSCTLAQVNNPRACRACTPVRDCLNTCEPCEVCVGRPAPSAACRPPTPTDAGTRPPDAGTPPPRDAATPPPADAGTSSQCPAGIQPCGLAGQAPCPMFQYCITGCCIAAPS
jgi:hypothetical protein